MSEQPPPHLLAAITANGRIRLPGLYDHYGCILTLAESVNNSEPLLRFQIKQNDGMMSAATLDVKTALHLIDQLHYMIDNHYLIRASQDEDQSRE